MTKMRAANIYSSFWQAMLVYFALRPGYLMILVSYAEILVGTSGTIKATSVFLTKPGRGNEIRSSLGHYLKRIRWELIFKLNSILLLLIVLLRA